MQKRNKGVIEQNPQNGNYQACAEEALAEVTHLRHSLLNRFSLGPPLRSHLDFQQHQR
jgi:hypothetical protein